MTPKVTGLHHVTLIGADARRIDGTMRALLGLRRVKVTVNFDAPDTYHLYYADTDGTPGTVMTYFPFPGAAPRRPGSGETSETVFAVPEGALAFWEARLANIGLADVATGTRFGAARLTAAGSEGEGLAFVESPGDARPGHLSDGVGRDAAIKGFAGVTLRLADGGQTAEVLEAMGYARHATDGPVTRYVLADGNGADWVDIEVAPDMPKARQSAGSVHHVAFAVPDGVTQEALSQTLRQAGLSPTPVIDRDYFKSIYFPTPDGVLFEVATDAPGFARDEDQALMGQALKLPTKHEHLRDQIEARLTPLPE